MEFAAKSCNSLGWGDVRHDGLPASFLALFSPLQCCPAFDELNIVCD